MAAEGDFPNSDVKGALRKAWTMSKSYLGFKKSKKITRERLTAKGVPSKIPSVFYKCEECEREFKETESTGKKTKGGNPKRRFLVKVDHVEPVVDPIIGFQNWADYWSRLYIPPEDWATKLQLLCSYCHKSKTTQERDLRVLHGTLKRNGKTEPT
jgi:hypothetical protein